MVSAISLALEALHPERFRMACERLASVKCGDKDLPSDFPITSASNPFPFFPKKIPLRRDALVRSTRNGERLGSVYNNWSLPTIFDSKERNIGSVEDLCRECNIPNSTFKDVAERYWDAANLQNCSGVNAKARDVTTWSGVPRDFEDRNQRVLDGDDFRIRAFLRAASKGGTFVVVKDGGIFAIGNEVKVKDLETIKQSLDKIFIAMCMSDKQEKGIVVPCLFRLLSLVTWVIGVIGVITVCANKQWMDLELWSMEYFQSLVFAAVSVPALLEFVTDEPCVIRNSLRGNRVLWKNSHIRAYFGLSKFDYAVMALLNNPMWLVSQDTASYLQVRGHEGLKGDEPVTDTDSLRQIGFFVGRSMARKEWEHKNWVVENAGDGSVCILKTESEAKRISGEIENKPVI